MDARPFGDLAMAVTAEDGLVCVAVSGEIDPQTAPTMGAVVGALVDQGHRPLVLDLAGLRFMDASGISIVVDIAVRLAKSSGELTVRSVPPLTRRLLDLTGVATLVHVEDPPADLDKSGPGEPVAVATERLPDALAAREVIAQAQGVHMARHGGSAEDAAAAIHRAAREREVTVLAQSADIVASTHLPAAPTTDRSHA